MRDCATICATSATATQDQLDLIGRRYFAGSNAAVSSRTRATRSHQDRRGDVAAAPRAFVAGEVWIHSRQDLGWAEPNVVSQESCCASSASCRPRPTAPSSRAGRSPPPSSTSRPSWRRSRSPSRNTRSSRHRSADADLEPPRFDRGVARIYDSERGRCSTRSSYRESTGQGCERPSRPSGRRRTSSLGPNHLRQCRRQRICRPARRRRIAIIARTERRGISRIADTIRQAIETAPFVSTGNGTNSARSPSRWASAWRRKATAPKTSTARPTVRSMPQGQRPQSGDPPFLPGRRQGPQETGHLQEGLGARPAELCRHSNV